MSKITPAERVPRAAACAARRRARGHRLAVAHLRAARLRQHRDPRRRAHRPAAPREARSTRRSTSSSASPPSRDAKAELGLHFDLTVPFARYVLEHAGHLEFPFRRFQVQPAWRGERPQEGRYRQFTQADVDIVGRDELPFHHDVEVMSVMVDALRSTADPAGLLPVQQPQAHPGLLPRARHRRRHRRRSASSTSSTSSPPTRSPASSSSVSGRRPEQAQRCLDLATIRVADTSFAERVRALGVERRAARPGAGGAGRGRRGLCRRRRRPGARRGQPAHRARPRLLHRHRRRDLHERLRAAQVRRRWRSLRRARQRRPDDLPRRRRVVRRVAAPLVPLIADGVLDGQSTRAQRRARRGRTTRTSAPPAPSVARALRARDIACEVAPVAAKFGKQIRFAERRGIPFVWFVQGDGTHQVKDIRTGEQVDADPRPGPRPRQRPATRSQPVTSADTGSRRTSDPHP